MRNPRHPVYRACESCSTGWVTRLDGTVVRCICWRAHRQKIAELKKLAAGDHEDVA
jgi:hypothetical protein